MGMRSVNTGMIILGGGLIKHHICNANLMRNGADFSLFVNTAGEFGGSDSGARPDEAVSWGKIRKDAKPVKIYAEDTSCSPSWWQRLSHDTTSEWTMNIRVTIKALRASK